MSQPEMISVSVVLVGELRVRSPRSRFDVDVELGTTAKDLVDEFQRTTLAHLTKGTPRLEEGHLIFLLNGTNLLHGDTLHTPLRAGDKLVVSRPLGGG